jgi:nucleotide-binding universal stress UspA family protein
LESPAGASEVVSVNMLIATDGSEEIYSASRLVAAIIRPESISRIIILSVTWPPNDAPMWNEATMRLVLVDDIHHAIALVATEAMDRIKDQLSVLGAPVDLVIKAGDPAQKVLEVAGQRDVELIVMGRRPSTPTQKSVSTKVLAGARCPVLVGSTSAIARDARMRM